MNDSWYSDCDSDYSSHSTSESSFDEEEVNQRIFPFWPKYRSLINSRGFRLDTVRDVREFYNEYRRLGRAPRPIPAGIDREMGDDALCPDEGLVCLDRFGPEFPLIWLKPANLFRGARVSGGLKIVVKAAHICSREYDIIRALSHGALREDPRNHTIRMYPSQVMRNVS
jgi:hypothetical protein